MAIITMLVGLGVLLAFTVLGCVLEVFLARRESIWPGLVLPILAGLYAVVMVLSYTVRRIHLGTRCWAACWRYSWFRASRLFCC